ncbi:hypothetical protein RJ639_029819 [Escallonia herrerae]|uniref:RAVE complex protein Rav1 C-terminal domain-containing protein n=1 Tax=Escallonia herrerae TaxID=1293975 RepID=A0AA88WXF2_9ASTE|nr:hypothetical protein RJ639_029819 [Escallonia herrerae]
MFFEVFPRFSSIDSSCCAAAIPPAPTRSESAIDWLPDFAGYSWIAYGASSLLVISHLPSPASDTETLIGPIFRQVLELSSDGSGSVSAVSWSPAAPSLGELAAALDNCIGIFSYGSEGSNGSFCWSQTAVLVQSTKVEALKWTFTGDGIISGGSEVVLWRKKPRSWEIAWKYKPEVPHVLVSATWSIEGPSATAPSSQLHAGSSSTINEASNCVLACHRSDRESNYLNAELRHPLPVSMIQWRPSTQKQAKSYERYPMRLVLLTCCLDGTIRLWSEIDDGKARKVGKDINDQRMARLSFRVCAVVEINQEMNGSLGSDIFVRWATEIDGIGSFGEDTSQYSSSGQYQPDRAGRCEWLIGFGPRMLVTLWVIHCLDDVAPIRFPRDPHLKYTTLRWGPAISDEDGVLLMGHGRGVWKNDFQALSWKVTIYPFDLSERSSGLKDTAENIVWTSETIFVGKKYCVSVCPCSSVLPDPQSLSQVTSFATVSPTNFALSEEEKCGRYTAYHMVTGCFDGSLKLWRSILAQSSNSISQWELVGMLVGDQGPILKASTTDCGRKIATVSAAEESNTSTNLHIWDTVRLSGAGSLILEDAFSLNGEVVALNWLTMGNVTKTLSPIRDFSWGPKNTAVVVHDEYFCLISQWLSLADKKLQTDCPAIIKDHKCDCNGGSYEYMDSAIFTGFDDCDSNGSLLEDNNEKYRSTFPVKMNARNHFLSSISVESHKQTCNSGVQIGFWSLLEVAEHFVGSLPVYHPEALLMNICSGNWKRAHIALQHLVEYLTSNHASSKRYCLAASSNLVPPVHLPSYLEGILSSHSSDNTFQWNGDAALTASFTQLQKGPSPFASSWYTDGLNNSSTSSSTRTEPGALVEPIEKSFYLAAITVTEKMQILSIIDLLDEITNLHSASAYGSLDEPGRRFWVAVRFQKLYFVRRFGRLPSVEDLVIDSELTAWAFHSDSQENLFNSLLSSEPSWQEMRNIGVGFWYTNATQLRLKMEKLARQQYLKSKDPKACALLYIALNRIQVLAGLFKISKDEKDKPLVGFLLRNFQEDKNKAAALKNAYVLLGRHQLELACAFFLLGGDAASAISVCAKNIGDEQLALVICRLVEGCGGSLERHLISKYLLPSAVERGNYWFASFLQWVIGNHLQAFLSMLGVQMDSLNGKSALFSNHASFLDPSIGQYCLMLATKNSMKNSIGERNAAILGRWAILMSATAFRRCGLPNSSASPKILAVVQQLNLEALECDSSSLSIFGVDQESVSDDANPELLHKILKPFPNTSSSNWILNDVAFHLLSYDKLDLAMQYITKLLTEHPSWPKNNFASPGACSSSDEVELQQYKIVLGSFQHKLSAALAYFEQKFSLNPLDIVNKIAVFLRNNGLAFIAYHISLCFTSKEPSNQKNSAFDGSLLYPILRKLLLKTTEEMPYLFSRYIVACSITCSHLQSCSMENSITDRTRVAFLTVWEFYMRGLTWSLWRLRAAFEFFSVSCTEDLSKIPFIILDLSEYYAYFASAWLQMNLKGVVLAAKPLLITRTNGYTPNDIDFEDLHRLLLQLAELLAHSSLTADVGLPVQVTEGMQHEHDGEMLPSLPVDKKWQIIAASLWGHMSVFVEHQLNSFPEKLENDYSSFNSLESSSRSKSETSSINTLVELLASLLLQKVGDQSTSPALLWLEELYQLPRAYHKHSTQGIDSLNMTENDTQLAFGILWKFCSDPKLLHKILTHENPELPQYIKQKLCKGWSDIYACVAEESEAEITCDKESRLGGSFAGIAVGSPVRSISSNDHSLMNPGVKDTTSRKRAMHFQNPKEVYRRNGELLEALCINSVDQQHAALASNRKGIIFFNLEDRLPSIDKSDYIWTEADWPPDGWAGSESFPVPTFVSPWVGLGSKKGTHLGLGGATIGVGSSARPGRDSTGGGAFGIPGYAGIGASGFGWETQEDFEEFVDLPATVENVRTRAFSSHPSRPFFLVGSSNTHFGKDTATATYGVHPAANVPPPYALASISAVKFDHCGQRFATAAFDGTEHDLPDYVGALRDVTYVTASGSIVAAAGHSSDGINVVIWDTLAPPMTSRASIMCHEGGAHSISVFDNDIGSGSVSPLIVTGGKSGDVGLHDFRYIATGRTKRHRHSDGVEQNITASATTNMRNKSGDQNRNGMLWYIPKAHSGVAREMPAINHIRID